MLTKKIDLRVHILLATGLIITKNDTLLLLLTLTYIHDIVIVPLLLSKTSKNRSKNKAKHH